MKYSAVRAVVRDTPYMGLDEAQELYGFVLNAQPANCLELGHAHGASSLYIAAAADEYGGHLDTVDLETAKDRQPNVESLLKDAGLSARASVCREKNSYTWFLKKKIEAQTVNGVCEPCYDFCFIDGPKNWTIDGLAFFLVEKLLRPKGWLLFDDYGWSHGKHQGRTQTDGITVRSLSDEEVEQPHIAKIFELLVMQHPAFSNFELQDDWWAWAQKVPDGRKTLKHSSKATVITD